MIKLFNVNYFAYISIVIKNKHMKKKLKSKLLTYLFTDWVATESDVETLNMTKQMIENRKNQVIGYVPTIGFKTNNSTLNIK